MKPTLYVIANKGLQMSPGKLAAQVAHATMGAYRLSKNDMQIEWTDRPHQWALILEAEDEMHLTNIRQYLQSRGFATHGVIDEGSNEVRPFSLTAVGVEVVDKDDPLVQSTLGLLKSYREEKREPPHETYQRGYSHGYYDGVKRRWWKKD